ncbi:translation initiation factor IF-2 [Planctomycetes bacterium K23_9]|uniref:Translation initiation factor IF-2 n=1 Tax=Stieleria marina TaxID=1930275 RepID=A0A517NSA3_9BACT|nr:Translation initiation factor IF-2 [Planctomycetes bacterium K23_9]
MPARIYALAKELKLDSKDLVDLVKKVGITGKGSALASLSDEEAQRVRDHLASSSQPAEPVAASTAPVAVRESVQPERSKPKPISIGRSTGPRKAGASQSSRPAAAKSEAPVVRSPAPLPPVAEKPPAPKEPVAKAQAPEVKLPPPPRRSSGGGLASKMGAHAPIRPNDPVAPIRSEGGSGGRIRSLDRSPSAGGKKDADDSKPKKREPRVKIKMAQLGEAKEPVAAKGANEPKAQKPDVKLSKDAIAGHKQGMAAPLEQLAKEDSESKRVKRGGLSGFTGEKKRGTEEEEKPQKKKGIGGMASVRAERSRGNRRQNSRMDRSGYGGRDSGRGRGRTLKRKGTNTAAPRKDAVVLELPCTIRSFSEAAGIPVASVLKVLMGMQMMVNINSELDLETAEMIAAELDLTIELKAAETLEDELITELENQEDDPDSLVPRAPIVTFLGHVDHGKTSLLDYLIGINVVSGEAGGITQHIRAYEVEKDGRSVTFVDTPGHEAFTEMRARGANVTDIAVLVIAADDGIMPQTEEAISHAKAADVPIVVAMNKIDVEGVDPNRVMTQLTEHQLTPSEWGGEVEVVQTSATKGIGMDELLETLLTVAELNEYTANPNREALGVCLESEQQGDRGVVAKLIVQNGTMRVGDILVCGPAHGRVRAMTNTLTGKPVEEAGPSTPVNLIGLDTAPGAGDRFHVLSDIGQAREIAGARSYESSRENLSGITTKVSFENFQDMLLNGQLGQDHERVKLNVIIRADAKGSLEAIDKELAKFDHPEVEIRVLQRSVGGVTLADVTLASASDAVILAFNVIPDEQARSLADERNVQVRRYEVIYKLTDDIKAMVEGRLKPEEKVVELGRAVVKQVFSISRVGTIAGCYVVQGSIQRGCRIRVNRDGRTIGDYGLDSLKRIKEDVKEVPRGMECGIRLQGFNDIKQDDVLEAYRIEEVARTLD